MSNYTRPRGTTPMGWNNRPLEPVLFPYAFPDGIFVHVGGYQASLCGEHLTRIDLLTGKRINGNQGPALAISNNTEPTEVDTGNMKTTTSIPTISSAIGYRAMKHGLGMTGYSNLNIDPKISTATWAADKPLALPNPWLDVANFVPTSLAPNQQDQEVRLTHFPVDIIYYFIKFLPKEATIALALTNKAMYEIVGPWKFSNNLTILERWNLMLLLERDLDLFVACQQCKSLHGPFPAGLPALGKAHNSFDSKVPCVQTRYVLLPPGLSPALCRLIAKRYIRHQPYSELLSMGEQAKMFTTDDFKFFISTTLRMVDGSLYVRQESHVAPLNAQGNLTSRSAYLCDATMVNGAGSPVVCSHVKWKQLGLDLSHKNNSDLTPDNRPRPLAEHLRSNNPFDPNGRYALGHKQAQDGFGTCRYHPLSGRSHLPCCYDSTVVPTTVLDESLAPSTQCVLFHPQPCKAADCAKLAPQHQVNLVRACPLCPTDMCVSAQDVQGIGRVISLTSWRKLGGVYEGQPGAWYAQYDYPRALAQHLTTINERQDVARDLGKGATVYAAFEKPDGRASGSSYTYTASISCRVRRLFTGKPQIPTSEWDLHIPGWEAFWREVRALGCWGYFSAGPSRDILELR